MFKNPLFKNRPNPTLENRLPSITKQAEKDKCNIQNIIKLYSKTGMVPESLVNQKQPQYIDNTQIPSYQDSLSIIANAKSQFENLPPELQKRFKTLQSLTDFLNNPENQEEAIKLGLMPNVEGLGQPIEPASPSVTEESKEQQSKE